MYCECGCGQITNIAKKSRRGYKLGEHLRFISGHNTKFITGEEQSRRSKYRFNPIIWDKIFIKSNVTIDSNGCWLWDGTLSSDGYGPGKKVFELYKDKIQKGLVLRHTCDVGRCVNPDHLITGTQFDNVQDMIERGRWRKTTPELSERLSQCALERWSNPEYKSRVTAAIKEARWPES